MASRSPACGRGAHGFVEREHAREATRAAARTLWRSSLPAPGARSTPSRGRPGAARTRNGAPTARGAPDLVRNRGSSGCGSLDRDEVVLRPVARRGRRSTRPSAARAPRSSSGRRSRGRRPRRGRGHRSPCSRPATPSDGQRRRGARRRRDELSGRRRTGRGAQQHRATAPPQSATPPPMPSRKGAALTGSQNASAISAPGTPTSAPRIPSRASQPGPRRPAVALAGRGRGRAARPPPRDRSELGVHELARQRVGPLQRQRGRRARPRRGDPVGSRAAASDPARCRKPGRPTMSRTAGAGSAVSK